MALLGVGLAATGCGGSSAGSGARAITLYSGQHEQTVAALAKAFEARTGIRVRTRSGNENELSNQIAQEGPASPADVFLAANPPALTALEAKGLLAPVSRSTLARVPSRYSSARGAWVGVSARSAAIVFNPSRVSERRLPSSVLGFASSSWKDKFAFAPTETDFLPIVTATRRLRGDAAVRGFLEGLKGNAKRYADNEAIVAAVNRGEVAAGLIEHYYYFRLRDELGAQPIRSRLAYLGGGDPGALVAVSGAGVVASSKQRAAAQRFLAFLVSKEGETVIARSESYEYPLGSGVKTAKPLRPFARLQPPALSVGQLGDGRQAVALMQQAGLL